ncbi:UbiA prenyltransferase family protein [Streptosporangium sp. KLBMP 9127]|nr:UbiA prenyltransferase family protein [Streptosporangium sp. KLBMP 9127]
MRISKPEQRNLWSSLITLLRPTQWIKNLVVFVLPFLTGALWTFPNFIAAAFGALLFTLVAAATYVINDVLDRERDSVDAVKCHRPVASGAVSVKQAIALAAFLYLLAGAAIVIRPLDLAIPVALYATLTFSYNTVLKHVALLDIIVLAAGFVLRAACGALAVGMGMSPWATVCILSVSMLLALGKRRHEMMGENSAVAVRHRPSLVGYSDQLIAALISMSGAITLVSYVAFLRDTVPNETKGWLIIGASSILAMFGLARYLQAVFVGGKGADPTRLLVGDRTLRSVIILWALCFLIP